MASYLSVCTSRDTTALVELAKAGDKAAFDRLAFRFRPMVKGMAFMRTSRMDDAEDLAQVILVKAWRQLASLSAPEAFVSWLQTIAVREMVSWRRSAQADTVPLADAVPTMRAADLPEEAALRRMRWHRLRAALASLPPANRTALLMHAWGEYSYAEIAEAADVSVTTVEGRIFRARRQLEAELRQDRIDLFGDLITLPRPKGDD